MNFSLWKMKPVDAPFDLIRKCMHYAYGIEAYTCEELVSSGDAKSAEYAISIGQYSANAVLGRAVDVDNLDIARVALKNGAYPRILNMWISPAMLELQLQFGLGSPHNLWCIIYAVVPTKILYDPNAEYNLGALKVIFREYGAPDWFDKVIVSVDSMFDAFRVHGKNYTALMPKLLDRATQYSKFRIVRILLEDGAPCELFCVPCEEMINLYVEFGLDVKEYATELLEDHLTQRRVFYEDTTLIRFAARHGAQMKFELICSFYRFILYREFFFEDYRKNQADLLYHVYCEGLIYLFNAIRRDNMDPAALATAWRKIAKKNHNLQVIPFRTREAHLKVGPL